MVNGQLYAQFFSMYIFQFSTCFEQSHAHHQENQLYQYNIWYMSLCVGDRFVWPDVRVRLPLQWQPTSDILTGYISSLDIYHPDPWHAPVAATTVFSTPDDGRRERPKHVE